MVRSPCLWPDPAAPVSPLFRCEITSREYCDFMRGYFHEEATLCSQVGLWGACPYSRTTAGADQP